MYRKDESRILVFSRKHESRILVFLLEGFIDPFCFYRFWKRQNGNIENRNRRNRKHESRILTFSRKHESRILVFYWRILLILFVFIVFRKARMKKQKTGIGAIENMNLAFSRFHENTNLAFSFFIRGFYGPFLFLSYFGKARMKKQKTRIGAIENMNLAFSRFRENTNLAFSHSRFLFQVSMDPFYFYRFWKSQNEKVENRNRRN